MNIFEYPLGATPLDPEESSGLKLSHITTREELDRWEQENIEEAYRWVETRHKGPILTEDFICKLHKKMFDKVWRWAGTFRLTDKNIGVPWTQVRQQLHGLLGDVEFWLDNETFSADQIAFRFHHKLVQIHVFPNGNGRHARLLTDVLLAELLNAEAFTWGSSDLYKTNESRALYIRALKAADNNDYSFLEAFVRT